MGVQARIVLYAGNRAAASSAAAAAFARVAQLDAVMSDYRPDSELMRLCDRAGGEPIPVSADLFAVLERSLEISQASDGAFDVTIGPVSVLWREAARSGTAPSAEALAQAYALVDPHQTVLDRRHHTVQLLRPNMRLDLGGIGQGYAADAALEVLRKRGCTRCLIDIGGDIVAGDPPPRQDGWSIAVSTGLVDDVPLTLALANAAVTTSGDSARSLQIDGRRHSHIIDPRERESLGLAIRRAVTVIALDAATADALATAVSVLGPQRGMELVESLPTTSAMIVEHQPEGRHVFTSRDFPAPAR
jgi:thiamine biosynthesis lipoprotein